MNANTQTSFTGLEGKLRSPLKSKLLPRLTLCVCKKKKKKTFYFNSENQRGYLTDFPFVLLIVLMKPKKPKIFFSFFSTACAQLHTRSCSALNNADAFCLVLLPSPNGWPSRGSLNLNSTTACETNLRWDAEYNGEQAELVGCLLFFVFPGPHSTKINQDTRTKSMMGNYSGKQQSHQSGVNLSILSKFHQ